MKVFLVRHARPRPENEDPSKSLSDIGKEEIRRSAGKLASKGNADLEMIFHSGKARARQTAEILYNQIGSKNQITEAKGLNPNDPPAPWSKRLSGDEFTGNIAIVGHLPFLGNLASLMLHRNPGGGYIEFNPATIACLIRQHDGSWLLEWTVNPSDSE